MAIAMRTAHTTWEGPLASGTGLIRSTPRWSPGRHHWCRRGARNAAALRATIAALSLALLALGTVIAT